MDSNSPLFQAGLHEITENDFENIFVVPFKGSATRSTLILRLKAYLKELKEIGLNFEIWIDGSFSTNKSDPNDIDIAVFASSDDINGLAIDKRDKLMLLLGEHDIVRARYNCDVYFVPLGNEIARSYWRGWFGFSRGETPKGIPKFYI